jgi:hypothetical protein
MSAREMTAVGVLDDVLCNNDLFGDHKGETHCTQSLHPVFPGSTFEVTPTGRLELLECTYEDRSDPNAPRSGRLAGMMTPVFTGQRSDVALNGWLEFPGFGRAKFTDGTLVAFEPESDQSLERNQPPMTGFESRSASALESTIITGEGGPAEYLRCFFFELERMKRRISCDVSHAIGFRDGKLHVLISIGDVRERVYVQDLDQDPASAAQDVFLLWRTTPRLDKEIE